MVLKKLEEPRFFEGVMHATLVRLGNERCKEFREGGMWPCLDVILHQITLPWKFSDTNTLCTNVLEYFDSNICWEGHIRSAELHGVNYSEEIRGNILPRKCFENENFYSFKTMAINHYSFGCNYVLIHCARCCKIGVNNSKRTKRRLSYPNSVKTFHLLILKAGDVETNPGPKTNNSKTVCTLSELPFYGQRTNKLLHDKTEDNPALTSIDKHLGIL